MSPSLLSHASVRTKKKKTSPGFSVGMVMPLTAAHQAHMFLAAVEPMCELGFEVAVLAEGDALSQKRCFALMEEYGAHFSVLESTTKNRKDVSQGADILVFPSPPEQSVLRNLIKKKQVAILPEGTKGFTNFDAQKESGNAFTFVPGNFWSFLAAIIRASENHKFSYDWKNLQKNVEATVV